MPPIEGDEGAAIQAMFQAEETQWVETQEHMAQYAPLFFGTETFSPCSDNSVFIPRRDLALEVAVGSGDHSNLTKNSKENYHKAIFAIDVA